MSLDIATYTRRPVAVEAVQVTAGNLDEVAAWCGTTAWDSEYVQVEGPDYSGHAAIGDWVIRWPGDAFTVHPDEDSQYGVAFCKEWSPSPDTETGEGETNA